MVAAKLFELKFGHQAVKTLVGCYGRSMDFTAFKQALAWSILARQHDHPVLLIPAGVERDGVQRKVCIWNLLPGVFLVIAIFVDHHRPALCDLHLDHYKPILSADLSQITGNGIHHPKASAILRQVLSSIGEHVTATDSVIRTSACELGHGKAVQSQLLKFSVCFHLCVPVCKHDHSFVSDSRLDNRNLVTR